MKWARYRLFKQLKYPLRLQPFFPKSPFFFFRPSFTKSHSKNLLRCFSIHSVSLLCAPALKSSIMTYQVEPEKRLRFLFSFTARTRLVMTKPAGRPATRQRMPNQAGFPWSLLVACKFLVETSGTHPASALPSPRPSLTLNSFALATWAIHCSLTPTRFL